MGQRNGKPGFFSAENIAAHNQGRTLGEIMTGRQATPSQRLGRQRVHTVMTERGQVAFDAAAGTITLGVWRRAETHPTAEVTVRVEASAGSRITAGRVVALGPIGLLARKRDTPYLIVDGPTFLWECPLAHRTVDEARAFAGIVENWRRQNRGH